MLNTIPGLEGTGFDLPGFDPFGNGGVVQNSDGSYSGYGVGDLAGVYVESGPPTWDTQTPGMVVLDSPVQRPPASGSSVNGGALASTIVGGGLQILNTVLGYNLQQSQISKGQVPTIGYDAKTGAPTGQSVAAQIAALQTGNVAGALSTSAWVYLLIGGVILILIARR